MYEIGLIAVACVLSMCWIEICFSRREYRREKSRADNCWCVAHRQSEKALQRVLKDSKGLEQLYYDVSSRASRFRLKYQDMVIENAQLRAELKRVKEKYRHAVDDVVVFED